MYLQVQDRKISSDENQKNTCDSLGRFRKKFSNKIMQIKKSRYSEIIDGNILTNNYESDKNINF